MKLFRDDPAQWFAAGGLIGVVLGALFGLVTVAAVTVIIFSLERAQ